MEKEIIINNYKLKYEHFIRDIKYPRLEYKSGKLTVITPAWYKDPKKLILKKEKWIMDKEKLISEIIKKSKNKKIIKRTIKKFEKIIVNIAMHYSQKLNSSFKKIYFKNMTMKWASCSAKGNITLNKNISMLPLYLIKYIIYHELIHLKIRKHNKEFFKMISDEFPYYEKYERELMQYWFVINKMSNNN